MVKLDKAFLNVLLKDLADIITIGLRPKIF